jgi:hypothetical protein
MRLARLEGQTQWFARPEQVRLAYQFIKRAWTQPVGERGIRRAPGEEIIH